MTTQLEELEVLVRGRLDKLLAGFAPLAPTLRKLYIELLLVGMASGYPVGPGSCILEVTLD